MLILLCLLYAAVFDEVPEYLVTNKTMTVTWSSNSTIIVNLNIQIVDQNESVQLAEGIPLYQNRSDFQIPEIYVNKTAQILLVTSESTIVTGPPLQIRSSGSPILITPDDVNKRLANSSSASTANIASNAGKSSDSSMRSPLLLLVAVVLTIALVDY